MSNLKMVLADKNGSERGNAGDTIFGFSYVT